MRLLISFLSRILVFLKQFICFSKNKISFNNFSVILGTLALRPYILNLEEMH